MLCGCLNGKVGIGDGAAVGFAVLGASLYFHMLLYAVQVDIEGRDVKDVMKMDETALDLIGDDSFSFNGGCCLTITQSDR